MAMRLASLRVWRDRTMTPQQLVDLVRFVIDWGGPAVEAWRDADPSSRPQGVPDRILERLLHTSGPEADPAALPSIAQEPDGLWRVDGLAMAFRTRSDAEIAADVVTRVRATEP
jgi:hypothetical protein